jgi:uncharacterized protein YidB (DUF937 family)
MTAMQHWIRFPMMLWGQRSSEEFARAVDDLIRRHGAVSGVVSRMERIGLGAVAQSWVTSDVRQPIYSEQLHALFGTGALRAMAAKLNLEPRDLVRRLSQALPRAIHQLSTAGAPTARASEWAGSTAFRFAR